MQSWDRGWFSEGQGEALSDPLEPCSQPCSEQELGLRPPEVLPTSLFCAAVPPCKAAGGERGEGGLRKSSSQVLAGGEGQEGRDSSSSVPSLLWGMDSHPPA